MSGARKPLSRRELVKLAAGVGVIGGGWAALKLAVDSSKPKAGNLGRFERANEHLESFLFSNKEFTPGELTPAESFPMYHVAPSTPIMPPDWKLIVAGMVGKPLALTLDDLMKLPRTEYRIEHHCVEGWSAVATWTGVRLSEIAKLAQAKDVDYVEFRSFDVPRGWRRGYWSSWDRDSAMHPQTLIAYGMNGKPLSPAYGAPVKVYSAVKLGYKNVKYLSEINFLDTQTGGYWENSGYEWHGGV
ncbi:MAG TPA: molybdopterin-dependent oxidoreductase [Kofleriaceae bacterium]|nr:molybdopterin-dependent oxidoreductase [Kofleriaceae bacterium]